MKRWMMAALCLLLAECIETCTAVTRSSWYISPQENGPVGFVLGGNLPVIVYSPDGVGFLYRVSWLRQQEDGSWQLCLTQEPTGVNGYDWCAVFTAQTPEGPWTYQAKQPDPVSR